MKVKAARAMSYGNKHYASGDAIEMTERDAKLLAAVGRVSLHAEASAKKPAPKSKSKKRSGYKRRDMRAEDTTTENEAERAEDAAEPKQGE